MEIKTKWKPKAKSNVVQLCEVTRGDKISSYSLQNNQLEQKSVLVFHYEQLQYAEFSHKKQAPANPDASVISTQS